MITTLLSIKDINDSLIHVLNLMIKIFTPMIALTTFYICIGRPMLRTVRRARLNERERHIEHQKHLRYKFDNQYNVESTKAGLEKQELTVEE